MAKKDILQRAKEIRAQRAQDNLQGVDVTAENDVLARAKQIRAARRGEVTYTPTPVEDTAKIEEARKEYNERQATLDKMDTQRTISGIINRGLGREAEETHSMFNSLGRSIGVRDDIDYEMMAKRQQPLLDYLTTGETEHSWRMPLYNEIGTENLADIDKPIVDEQYIPRGEELIKLVGKNSGATDRTRNYGMDDHLRAGYMLHPELVSPEEVDRDIALNKINKMSPQQRKQLFDANEELRKAYGRYFEPSKVVMEGEAMPHEYGGEATGLMWSDAHPAPVEPIMRPSKDGLYHIGDETYTEDEMQNALTALIPMAQHGRRMDLNPHYRDAFAYELYGKNFNDAYYGEMDKLLAELDRLEANIAERTRAKSQQYVETYGRPVNARATADFVSQSGANSSADNVLYIERAKDYVNSLKDNSFKAGLKEGFDLYDFATAGVSGLFQEGQLKRILDKANSGKRLTDEERTMYEVWGIMQEADALQRTFYRPEPSFWNKVGRGVGESAEMLPSFALGMGSVEAIGAKSIGLAGLKQIARKQGMKGLAKHTFNRAGVYGLRAGAATPASPMMWSNYMKRRNDQYSIVDGNLVKRETSALGDLGIAYVETFNEYYSEMLGGGASKLIDISPSMFGRLINIDKWGGKMGLGKAMDYVNSVIPSDKVRNTMINMGFSGPLTEAPSEAIGDLMTNAMLAPFSDEYGFEHFKDPDYYKELLMTTTIFGGGMGVFSVGSQINNVREVNKGIKKRDYAMSKINDESLANSLKGVMALDSIDEMSNALVGLHLETLPADQAAAAIEYIANATQVKVGTAEMMEETRMSQFADVVKRFEGFTYQGKDGTMPSDRIVAVKDKKSGEVYYVTRGDYDANSDVHMLKVKNAQGEDMSVISSAVEYLDETTLDTRLIDVYENMFGADIAAERIAEVEGAVRSMENPTREDIRAHYMRNGFQVYNNGSEVTLVDGRKAVIEGMLDNGHYLVRSVNPATQMEELFDIPFMQVLQTNDAVAKGQQKYFNDNVNEVAEDIAKEEAATETTEDAAETPAEATTEESVVEEQVAEDMPKELPMREDGSVDLDAITDVKTFAEQFTLASGGVQQAIESVKAMATRAHKSAEELREKSKTLINANEVVDANKKAAALEERANFYDSVVAEMDTEAVETPATDVEETTPVEFKEGDLVEHNGRGARILEVENGEAILDYSMQDGIVNRDKMEIGKAPVTELKPLAEDATAEDVTEEAVEDAVEEEIEKADNGVVDNIYAKLLPKKMRNVLDTMAKNLGVKVVFAEEVITAAGTHANADVRGNVVRIAWGNRGKSIDFLAGHEFLHRMKDMGPEAYEEFKQSVIDYLGEAEWNRRIGKMKAVYESHNKRAALKGKPLLSYSEALLEEEVVADVAGELVSSHHAFDIYVNKQQGNISLLDKVRKVLRAISDYVRRLGARTEAQRVNEMVGKLNTLIDRAMAEAKKKGVNLSNEQMFSLESQPIFYSNAEYAVRGIKQEKATPEQWLKMIEKNGGLKAGEDKWLGLSDWLKASDKKSLTKDEVLQYIAENDIQIEEVQYSETNTELLDRVGELTNDLYYIDEGINSLSESIAKGKQRLKTLTDAKRVFDEKAEALKQEYGEDSPEYQNHIFYDSYTDDIESLEASIAQDEEYYNTQSERADALRSELEMLNEEVGDEREINSTRLDYTTKGLGNKREIALVVPTIEPWNTSDNIHFGDAGEGRAVAWIRFGETTDAEGKRVLVIDEIQSKRHQEGREKGYRDVEAEKREKAERERELTEVVLPRLAELNQLYNEKYGVGKWRDTEYDRQWRPRRVYRFLTPEEQSEHESLSIRATELQTTMPRRNGIPSAPFEKNWAELAMKRMLRYAAENGFDKVAWTTGGQQAERYNMSNYFNSIKRFDIESMPGRRFELIGSSSIGVNVDEEGKIISSSMSELEGKLLADVVGKEMAVKMMQMENNTSLEDADLKIGGSGMKGFYDQMLPSFVRKYAKKWGATVGEVTMPDLEENNTMHSVDVTPAMRESVMQGQPKFSLQGSDKSLVGLHNISLDKLRKAIKMGGLANPSVAVIDVDKATHEDYGDYTLVLTSNMVDARLGRNAGTWAGDAWTPTYPQVVKRIAMSKDITRFHKDISKMPEAMRNRVRLQLNSFLEDRPADSFAYWYLFEKGVAPEMAVIPPVFPDDIVKMVSEATDGTFNMWRKSDEQKARCVDAYIAYKYDGDRAAYEADLQDRKERLQRALNTTKSQLVAKKAAGDLAALEEFGFDYDTVSTFLREVETDNSRRGQSDVQGTIRLAEDYIKDNNLEEDYQSWRDSLEGRYGVKEYIFDGYTDSGNQRWLPHTTANASKWMKKQGREGATGTFPSFGLFVATVIPRMTTLNTIRKRKGHLGRPGQEYEAFKEKWENVYFELGQKLQPDAERFEDYGWWRLIEAVSTNNPKEHIKKQYGIELSDEDMQKLNDMLDAIKSNYPARYFETKFERPVELSEFIAAVVPNDIPADVEASLQDAYLNVYKYDKGVEGSRQEAVLEATDSPNVRFSLMEEPENEARYSISATDMAEIEAERKSIIETAKANGTYLKAPNGKDTNLTPEQWVNVRTKRFKAWFGDWELAEIAEYLMSDDVVAILSGEEFVKDGIPLTKKVSEFYEDNYNGKVTRKGLGEVILDKRSVKDSTIHGFGKAKTAAFAAVPNIITEGRIIDEQKNWKGRNYDSVTIAAPIRIGGSNYVGIVIVRKGQGTNSNRFYLHEVVLQENLQDESFKTDTKADSHRGDIAKVMQKIFISKENSSKVIDENGEPKVVYHFTKGKFTTFSYDYFGKGNDMGNSGKAFYFTPDSDTIFGVVGSIKMPVFLNIRDPYYSYWGVSENELIEGLSKAVVFNRTKEELIAAINGMQEEGEIDEDTAKEAITAIENMPQEEYEEINSKDGVIAFSPRGPIFEYAAKYSKQIKSADPVTYDDNGNIIPLSERFNPKKEDIRYSLVAPTNEEVTYDNFMNGTSAIFEQMVEMPARKADYISRSGSRYWYGEDERGKYVIRSSDHWSDVVRDEEEAKAFNAKPDDYNNIASCYWALYSKPQEFEPVKAADIRSVDYNAERHTLNIVNNDGTRTSRQGVMPRDMRPYFDAMRGDATAEAHAYVANMVNERFRTKPMPRVATAKAYLDDFTKWEVEPRVMQGQSKFSLEEIIDTPSDDEYKTQMLALAQQMERDAESRGLDVAQEIADTTGWVHLDDGTWKYYGDVDITEDAAERTAVRRWLESKAAVKKSRTRKMYDDLIKEQKKVVSEMEAESKDRRNNSNYGKAVDAILQGQAQESLPIEDQILVDIALGQKLRWEDEKDGKRRGLKSELGLRSAKAEGMRGVTGGNTYVEDYVAAVMERNNGYENDIDDNDVRNAVIEVFGSYPSRKAALEELSRRYPDAAINEATEALNRLEFERNEALAQIDADLREELADAEANPDKYERAYEEESSWNAQFDIYTGALQKARNEVARMERNLSNARLSQREKSAAMRAMKKAVTEMLRGDLGRYTRKRDIQALMNAVNEAQTTYSMMRAIDKAMMTINELRLRKEEARMHNLLKMRIVLNETNLDPHTFLNNMVRSGQMTPAVARRVLDNYWRGINASGIPVAKGVDGDTAKVMGFISYWSNLDTFLTETGVGEEGIDAAIETIWRELNGEAVEKPIITRYDNVTAEEVTDTQRKFQGWSKASPEQRGEMAKAVGLIHGYLQVQQAIRNMNRESGTLAIEEDISKERKAIKELHKKIEKLKGEKVVVEDETIKDAEKQIREHEKAIDSLLRARLNARMKSAGKYNAGMPMVVEQLYQLNSAVEDLLHSGKINLQHFRGAQQEHQRELINMALEDIDKPQDETKHKHDYTAMQKIQAAWPVRYFRKHLPSMEHMLRRMGRNSVDGEGKVFNYFQTNLMRAHNRIFEETAKCNEMLTAKTEALFGEGMTYNRVMRKAERKVIGTVTERNGNDVAVQEYTIANALYTIAMWEQPIGRATLVKQGITEGVIKDLRARLKEDNPAWLEFERWVVDDFLPSRRVKYNAVYREMNGTDMGFEVNYFPIRRREPKKYQSVDLASPSFENKPSTMTGALIERTDNVMPIDIESSFFGVLKDNITEMEQWSEMAPVTRDFNLMLSSPRVKAAMDAIDEHFYEDFSEAAKVATLNYTGDQKKEDDILMQVALRMWGASKLAWKMYTALKQVTSGVLALPYSADPKFFGRLVWYASGGKGMVSDAVLEKIGRGDLAVKEQGEPLLNIQWAIKNSPMFKRRWQSGVAGNDIFTRELKYEDHTRGKRAIRDISQGLDWFAQMGMKPIAFVDACTVATIMRTVYDYEREALLADGYSEEEANEKAMFRAELFANKTQQSSETEYLSPLQMERGVTSMITIFQNAPFAQGRMMADAWNELTRDIDAEIATATTQEYINLRKHKYAEDIKAVEDTIAKEKKAGVITNNEEETMRRDQLMRPLNEKIKEEAATRAAKRISNAKFKAVRTFIYNGWLGQAVFNISGYLPYLIFGDDDEKKKVMLKDWAKMSMLGPIGTVPLGSALLSAINGHQLSLLGAYAELEEGVNDIAKDIREGEWSEVLFTVGDFLFNKLAGVDYKTWLNAWAGIENMFEEGMSAEAMLRAMNAPESQMRLLIGDRKEGETFEEYTTRIMCMYTTIFSNAEYGYYFDKRKRKKGVDAPFGMSEKQMNEMNKTYDKAYRANVVSNKGGAQEWANTVAVDKAYTEAVETLGWKANTKPKVKGQRAYDIEKKKYYLVDAPIEGMTIEEYNTLVSLGNAVAIAARNAEKYLGQDEETYLEYVREEVEAKREFMAEYNKIIDK